MYWNFQWDSVIHWIIWFTKKIWYKNIKNLNDSNNFIISKSHVTFSILSFAFLPLAASVIRFGYGSNQKMAIAGLYTIFIVASYATAFYGLAAVYQEKQGHFNTRHGLFGLVLLILLYIFVPIMAVVSLWVSKKYEPDLNDDLDNDKGLIYITSSCSKYNSFCN